jgi:hypothetical protein
MKPLADMPNLPVLLHSFAGSKAIWMYRDYRDVVHSNLAKWGLANGIRNLRRFLADTSPTGAQCRVPEDVRRAVAAHYTEDMPPYDAAALVWLIRNSLLFGLNLETHPNVTLCRYEYLVQRPAPEMQCIYAFLGHPFPGQHILREIHAASAGKGASIELSADVESCCRDMLARLDLVPP